MFLRQVFREVFDAPLPYGRSKRERSRGGRTGGWFAGGYCPEDPVKTKNTHGFPRPNKVYRVEDGNDQDVKETTRMCLPTHIVPYCQEGGDQCLPVIGVHEGHESCERSLSRSVRISVRLRVKGLGRTMRNTQVHRAMQEMSSFKSDHRIKERDLGLVETHKPNDLCLVWRRSQLPPGPAMTKHTSRI